MKRFLVVALVACGALLYPAAAGAVVRECGNYDGVEWTFEQIQGAGIFDVTAKNVGCGTARRVVLRSGTTYKHPQTRWRYGRWTCRFRSTGIESSATRCARGNRVVRWESGA